MTTGSLSKLSYFFFQNKEWTWQKFKSHLYKGPHSTHPFNNAKHKTWTDIQKIASFFKKFTYLGLSNLCLSIGLMWEQSTQKL